MPSTTAPVTSNPPSRRPLQTVAGQFIGALQMHMQKNVEPHIVHFAVVVSVEAGPPASLTVLIHGEEISDVRFIGTTPLADDVVVVLKVDTAYVSLGVLQV